MTIKRAVKSIRRRLDKLSPYPLFYPFIMSENEKAIFDAAIKESNNYLEFGLGGSSIRAIQKSKAKIYTVESSPDWIRHMRKYIYVKYFVNKRLFIFPVDIGPTGEWGYPKTNDYQPLFSDYSANVFKEIDSNTIDLVLVDGRFRVACILKVILECLETNNLKILIHDFWNREEYHVVLKYLDAIDKADTIGLFSIKDNVDLKSVKSDYDTYKYNPS
ncbi:hypothetical protein [Amphritea sp. HPY]|uniref:hypothetical protein n=1 Tax=Amphritea sp. HPY TaxID=3421652 RepID=UPI003D7E3525